MSIDLCRLCVQVLYNGTYVTFSTNNTVWLINIDNALKLCVFGVTAHAPAVCNHYFEFLCYFMTPVTSDVLTCRVGICVIVYICIVLVCVTETITIV